MIEKTYCTFRVQDFIAEATGYRELGRNAAWKQFLAYLWALPAGLRVRFTEAEIRTALDAAGLGSLADPLFQKAKRWKV